MDILKLVFGMLFMFV